MNAKKPLGDQQLSLHINEYILGLEHITVKCARKALYKKPTSPTTCLHILKNHIIAKSAARVITTKRL